MQSRLSRSAMAKARILKIKILAPVSLLIALIAVTGSPNPVLAADSPPGGQVQALYQGHLVSYAKLNKALGTTYCDDFRGYGKLTCFATDRAMNLDLLARGAFAPREAALVAHQLNVKSWPRTRIRRRNGTCWPAVIVTLWARPNFRGSAAALFCSYPNLGAIGWANRARSAQNAYLFFEIQMFKYQLYRDAVETLINSKGNMLANTDSLKPPIS